MNESDLKHLSKSEIVRKLKSMNTTESRAILKSMYERDMLDRRHYLGLISNIEKTWNIDKKSKR